MKNKKPIVYIDMDDTLCDFMGPFHKGKVNLKYPHSKDGFFLSLEPLNKSIESYKKLEKRFDVRILTAPSVLNPLCYTEKRLWVEKHLGLDACHKMIICPDKSLLKGDFLIDDSVTKGQTKFEGKFIRYGFKDFENWDKVISYFDKITKLDLMIIKLKKLYR